MICGEYNMVTIIMLLFSCFVHAYKMSRKLSWIIVDQRQTLFRSCHTTAFVSNAGMSTHFAHTQWPFKTTEPWNMPTTSTNSRTLNLWSTNNMLWIFPVIRMWHPQLCVQNARRDSHLCDHNVIKKTTFSVPKLVVFYSHSIIKPFLGLSNWTFRQNLSGWLLSLAVKLTQLAQNLKLVN